MQPETVSVEVLAGGAVTTASHTFWQTRFGPVLVPAAPAAWTPTRAYALTDVNLENIRAFRQYREMGTARDLDEFRDVAAPARGHAVGQHDRGRQRRATPTTATSARCRT
jgi:hypothetical protein